MKIIGVIPARFGSKRLPGKPLMILGGKPIIQWVYERSIKSKYLERVIIATDDMRVMRAVWKFGGEAMLTSKKAKSGTDRVAEVSKKMSADIIVNIQGDEPLISPKTIDSIIAPMRKDKRLQMSTAANLITDEEVVKSENTVKVVVDRYDNALYFTRSPVPFYRNDRGSRKKYLQHCGIYAYRRSFLLRYAKLKQTPLEVSESLEQLRALEYGIRIRVVVVPQKSVGVDTMEDLERAEKIIAK